VLLPKPLPTTSAIDYYVSALGRSFEEARTSDYAPRVVAREGDCDRDLLVAGSASSATVLLGVTAGAPAVPAGFSADGIVAAPPSPESSAAQGGGGAGVGVLLGLAAVGGGGYLLYKQLSDDDEIVEPPPPPPFDGAWAGTTSQNRPLTLTVSGSGLTRFDSSIDTGTSPNAPGRVIPIQRVFSPALPLSAVGTFTFQQPGEPPLTVTGTLSTAGTGDGRIETGGRAVVTWRAMKR
jgi:hypothetical protein